MSYGIIYLITNLVNGKKYVGQTIRSIETRFKEHRTKSQYNTVIYKAIKKYGQDNFTMEEIDSAENADELNDKEIYWIKHYNCKAPNGYNLKDGGFGCNPSEETRKKLSKVHKGKKSHWKGKKLSEETKTKMSKARVGKKHSEETKEKMKVSRVKNISQKTNNIEVINIDTLEVFSSITKAGLFYNLDGSYISKVCRGKANTCGGFHWMYYEDYLEQQSNKDKQAS